MARSASSRVAAPRVPRKSDRLRTILCSMARIETVETGRVTEADLPAPDVSIVVTLFNEAASVEELYRRTIAALDSGPRDVRADLRGRRLDGRHVCCGGAPARRRSARACGAVQAELRPAPGDARGPVARSRRCGGDDGRRFAEPARRHPAARRGGRGRLRRRKRPPPRAQGPGRPFPAVAPDQRDAPPLYGRGRSRTSGAHSTRTVATPSSRCSDRSASRSSRRL